MKVKVIFLSKKLKSIENKYFSIIKLKIRKKMNYI